MPAHLAWASAQYIHTVQSFQRMNVQSVRLHYLASLTTSLNTYVLALEIVLTLWGAPLAVVN